MAVGTSLRILTATVVLALGIGANAEDASWRHRPTQEQVVFPEATHWAGWQRAMPAPEDDDSGVAADVSSVVLDATGQRGVFRCDVPATARNWLDQESLSMLVEVNHAIGPITVRIGITGIDTELYRYHQSWRLEPGERHVLTAALGPTALWEADGHAATWGAYATHYVRQVQVEWTAEDDNDVALEVATVQLHRASDREDARQPEPLGFQPAMPSVGEVVELRFLPGTLVRQPYAPETPLLLHVTTPTGRRQEVAAFFGRDYTLEERGGIETPIPTGAWFWAGRFLARESGPHEMVIVQDGTAMAGPPLIIEVGAGTTPGFLRLRGQNFEFEDGSAFFPIGLNACWPTDPKKGMVSAERLPTDRPVSIYDEWFRAMAANGINTSQLWMTPFWTALEWASLYDGYGGIGVYSPRAAWITDRVLAAARRHGIYLLLTVRNHHQFSMIDKGASYWSGNPWSSANGGPLEHASAWFTDPAALSGQADFLRHVLARWGEDQYVIAFNVLSEADNTYAGGISKTEVLKRAHFNAQEPQLPAATKICAWYDQQQATAAAVVERKVQLYIGNCRLRELLAQQVYRHAALPIVINDYYVHRYDTDAPAAQHMHHAHSWMQSHGKAMWITETGFSSQGEGLREMRATIPEVYWASSMMPYAGTAMYWWWNQVLDAELLELIRPVAAFWAGEDRRRLRWHSCGWETYQMAAYRRDANGEPHLSIEPGKQQGLRKLVLHEGSRACIYLFAYDDLARYADVMPVITNARLRLPQLTGTGEIVVEVWHTGRGDVIERQRHPETFTGTIEVPDFQADVAMKVWRQAAGTAVELLEAPPLEPPYPRSTLYRRDYPLAGELPADAAAAMALAAAATSTLGEAYWPMVDDQFSPWAHDWPRKPSFSDYDGWLHAPTDGTYTFATDSDEASFLWIDDTLVVEWPGNHNPTNPNNRQASDWTHTGEIALTAGRHRFRYLLFNSAGASMARAAWRLPDADTFEIIEDAFRAVPQADE